MLVGWTSSMLPTARLCTMDGAAPDTRLNAQRKAYTAARSDARTTRELADKAKMAFSLAAWPQ